MSGCRKMHMPVCVGKIQVLICVHAFVHLGGGGGGGRLFVWCMYKSTNVSTLCASFHSKFDLRI